MLKILVGVTHKAWFDSLAGLAPDEVNFWQPSGSGEFRALRPGDLFLFKLKAPWNAIARGGVFAHARLAPLSLAGAPLDARTATQTSGPCARLVHSSAAPCP